MIPITGFSPGIDPGTEGVVVDCTNLLPTISGMEAAGQGESLGIDAVPVGTLKVYAARLLNGIIRIFAATADAIYENSGAAWINRSRAGGYTTAPGETWCFTQFGDATIATNYTNEVQVSTSSGNFADLSGSPPKAKICAAVNGFVMLFGYNDGVNTHLDGWWASGLYNHTAWTPSPATQAANGRLFDTPGSITAGHRLGSGIVAYKNSSIFLGQYVGPPIIWSWTQITDNTGVYAQDCVVENEAQHFFIGNNGLFSYDGSRPKPIGAIEVKEWLKDNINQQYTANIFSVFDFKKSNIYFFYPSNLSSGELDEALVYNTITNKFGRYSKSIISAVDYSSSSLTWAQLGNLIPTWGSPPATMTWNSPLFYGSGVGLAFIGADRVLYKFESQASTSSLTHGDVGSDSEVYTLKRVRARFLGAPDSAQYSHFYKTGEGESLQTGPISSMFDNKFDLLMAARFHRGKIEFTGNHEITSLDFEIKQSGKR